MAHADGKNEGLHINNGSFISKYKNLNSCRRVHAAMLNAQDTQQMTPSPAKQQPIAPAGNFSNVTLRSTSTAITYDDVCPGGTLNWDIMATIPVRGNNPFKVCT